LPPLPKSGIQAAFIIEAREAGHRQERQRRAAGGTRPAASAGKHSFVRSLGVDQVIDRHFRF
jgi:hypothetical protein